MRIELEPKHVEYADSIARRRWERAIKQGRINSAPLDKQRWRDILGARCECAGYLWAKPVKWNLGVGDEPFKKEPDLHDFIDVKGVEEQHYSLLVQEINPAEYAYLLVLAHRHPVYEIKGWMWGWEAKAAYPLEDKGTGRPCHYAPQDALKDPELLMQELRKRQRQDQQLCHCGAYGCYSPNGRDWLCPEHSGLTVRNQ